MIAGTLCPVWNSRSAEVFLTVLHERGLLFHPEDDAEDCLQYHELAPVAMSAIKAGMAACWEHLPDPCETALRIMNEGEAFAE